MRYAAASSGGSRPAISAGFRRPTRPSRRPSPRHAPSGRASARRSAPSFAAQPPQSVSSVRRIGGSASSVVIGRSYGDLSRRSVAMLRATGNAERSDGRSGPADRFRTPPPARQLVRPTFRSAGGAPAMALVRPLERPPISTVPATPGVTPTRGADRRRRQPATYARTDRLVGAEGSRWGPPVFKTGGAAPGVARWVRLPCAPANAALGHR